MYSRVFSTANANFLSLYSVKPGVVYAEFPGTTHVAHVTWGVPNSEKTSNIDLFLMPDGFDSIRPSDFRTLKRADVDEATERARGMEFQITEAGRPLSDVIRSVAANDVRTHLERKVEHPSLFGPVAAHEDSVRPSSVSYVESVLPLQPQIEGTAEIHSEGKQNFLPDCLLDLNLDFAGWCPTGITPEGKLAPWNTCEYCYAGYKHKGYPSYFDVDGKQLIEQINEARARRAEEGKETRFLRLGKRTEAGYSLFKPQLVKALEACVEAGLSIIFPTKFLEYDSEISDLLKRTDATLLISLGNDRLEPGAVIHGRTQEVRIFDGLRYGESGVRVVPYVLVDPTVEDGGPWFSDTLKMARKSFGQVQLLPIRIRYRELGEKVLGSWDGVTESGPTLFGNGNGQKYEVAPDHTRLAIGFHRSLSDLISNNSGDVRVCHHNSCGVFCGKCFMTGEKGFAASR